MASIVENANTSNFYTFYICDQEDFDNMANKIHTLPKGAHIMLCFHGHGAKNSHDYIVTIRTPQKCIFIRDENIASLDLNHIIKTSLENDQFIYIISISCFWNTKYDAGLTRPTISFAPDESSRLPYHFSRLKTKINALHNISISNMNKEFMIHWFQSLKIEFNRQMNCWAHIGEDGKEIETGKYVLKYNDNICEDDNSWNSRDDEDRQLKEKREAEAMKRRQYDNSIIV